MLCCQVTVRLFGYDFSEESEFRFALGARERGADCSNLPFTVTVRVLKSLFILFFCFIANPYNYNQSVNDDVYIFWSQGDKGSSTLYSTLVRFRLPSADQMNDVNVVAGESPAFYVCSLERLNGYNRWIHQGKAPGVKLRTFQRALPLWIQVVIIAVLLTLSGLFSGLNLGKTFCKIYGFLFLRSLCFTA